MKRVYPENYVIDKIKVVEGLGCCPDVNWRWRNDNVSSLKLMVRYFKLYDKEKILKFEECCLIDDNPLGVAYFENKDGGKIIGFIHDEIISVFDEIPNHENSFALVKENGDIYEFYVVNR